MSDFLFYLGAFALALGLLIVVHEAGHFVVARWCGVKVLRFSVGFGKPILSRRFGPDRTELALGAFPLGGYVKMLDEREGEVDAAELPRAFNRQSVWKRFVIVLAGPVANFMLAIVMYWVLFVHGVEEPRPLLGKPVAQSIAERAGFQEGELVRSIDGQAIATWQELRWELLQRALAKGSATLEVINKRQEISFRRIELASLDTSDLEGDILLQTGFRFYRPHLPPVIGRIAPGGVADLAGLREGDRILAIDGEAIADWAQVVAVIREAPGRSLRLDAGREGRTLNLSVTPAAADDRGKRIGRIGIGVREQEIDRTAVMQIVRYGPVAALGKAAGQTWETSVFSLAMLGRMIVGEVSWKNLSGPVTIADYAGQSAKMGLSYYIKFLALISISLGVLNLLPIPLLDGGHLMYYIVEIIKGGPVSERVMEIGQQIGLALLAMLMAFAFYNDINRLVAG
ncbi:MAG: RIP metalloprotease RseP [Rhodocyclales bacterium]|jgi:regulator of sigma E protease|nr:RIP metalloprotease RseP [Rhodocyclales bacterium]CAG0954138.1 regulator of sigma E protease [Rhodocyclaceae bacterium]